jgi:thiol-disulfide isomerase/thioredoxin
LGSVLVTTLLVSGAAVAYRVVTLSRADAQAEIMVRPLASGLRVDVKPPPLPPGTTPLRERDGRLPARRKRPPPQAAPPLGEAGIGASLDQRNGHIIIASTAPGLGAAISNLNPGDEIVAIDGRTPTGHGTSEVVPWIRGATGTTVALTVRPMGSATVRTVTIVRTLLKGVVMPPPSNALEAVLPSGLLGKPMPMVEVEMWVDHAPALGKTLGGKALLIEFWATWCRACRANLPVLNNLAQQYKDQGLVIVGISIDQDLPDLQQFLTQQPLPFAVGWAPHDQVLDLFADAIPTMVLVGPDGVVRMVHTGSVPVAEIKEQVTALLTQAPRARTP